MMKLLKESFLVTLLLKKGFFMIPSCIVFSQKISQGWAGRAEGRGCYVGFFFCFEKSYDDTFLTTLCNVLLSLYSR